MKKLVGEYFCGNKASNYAIENGYLDYRTLSKSFDAVMNNSIIENTSEIGWWEQVNGQIDNEDEIQKLYDKINTLEDSVTEDITPQEEDRINEEIDELWDKIRDLENEQDEIPDIFQSFIISRAGAEILEDWTDEIVFYNEALDMYVWGVTHWGTSWDYVLTDIKLNCGAEAFENI